MNYTYLLRCADGSLYCGWTNDLKKRLKAHNAGRGSKYTRSRTPVKLVWWESFETREEAMSREFHIKRMRRSEKLKLTEAFFPYDGEEGEDPRERKTNEVVEDDAGGTAAVSAGGSGRC